MPVVRLWYTPKVKTFLDDYEGYYVFPWTWTVTARHLAPIPGRWASYACFWEGEKDKEKSTGTKETAQPGRGLQWWWGARYPAAASTAIWLQGWEQKAVGTHIPRSWRSGFFVYKLLPEWMPSCPWQGSTMGNCCLAAKMEPNWPQWYLRPSPESYNPWTPEVRDEPSARTAMVQAESQVPCVLTPPLSQDSLLQMLALKKKILNEFSNTKLCYPKYNKSSENLDDLTRNIGG